MPHEVFVSVAEDVVALRAIPRKIERPVLVDGDEVGKPVDHLLTAAELVGVVEIGKVGLRKLLICRRERGDDLLVDLVADVRLALERDHVLEA